MTNEIRQARLGGRLPGINFTEFAVLFILADTCRGESRNASISMSELAKLSGQERTSMWRAVDKLARLHYIEKLCRGNHFQASRYEVLPSARCADATCDESARCADATCTEAGRAEHVAFQTEHVAFDTSARCADATHPFIPSRNPEGESRTSGTSQDRPTGDSPSPPVQPSTNGKRPRCTRHAHIVDDAGVPRCPDCRDLRRAQEAELRDAAERETRLRAAEYDRVQRCPDCRGGHWMLEHDGTPADPARRCTHSQLQTPTTRDPDTEEKSHAMLR